MESQRVMISVKKQEKYTIFKVIGALNAEDILVQANKYLPGKKPDNSLWDFSKASKIDISIADMNDISSSIGAVSTDGKVRKVALVGSKTINIGLLNFFAAIMKMNNLPDEYQVFRDVDLAKDWLQKKSEKNEI